MSAGLMSCVRENSPPLENSMHGGGGNGSDTGGFTSEPDQQKRRRFHPLRNLRRIFRRRSVSQADTNQPKGNRKIQNFGTTRSTATDTTTLSSTGKSNSGSIPIHIRPSVGLYSSRAAVAAERRENLIDGKRLGEESSDQNMTSDYQRSLSEGRLVDSDISRDGLSQSHDSVFSETATASSLSITLKNELAHVLMKRRHHHPMMSSEEDVGLPKSPVSPQRKERTINNSAGSLSMLSMTSSDIDEERSNSTFGGGFFDSSQSSGYYNRTTSDVSRNSDEVDLNMSSTTKLSHSAAKHKIAVRPKKKVPTRNRRSREVSSALPATPEDSEEFTHKFVSVDIPDTTIPTNMKSKSLPPGANAKMMENHAYPTPKETKPTVVKVASEKSSSTSIYINKVVSKSSNFHEEKLDHHKTNDNNQSQSQQSDNKEDEGLFKRFLNRNSKKNIDNTEKSVKTENSSNPRSPPNDWDLSSEKMGWEFKPHTSTVLLNSSVSHEPAQFSSLQYSSLNSEILIENEIKKSYESKNVERKFRSGPAARQRIVPKDLTQPPADAEQISSSITDDTVLQPQLFEKQHKSEESLTIRYSRSHEELDNIAHSVSPPKTYYQPEMQQQQSEASQQQTQYKTPKIYGLSTYQQRVSKIDVVSPKSDSQESPRRKSVEKSKSFRIYSTDEVSNTLNNYNNLPSLPNLAKNSGELLETDYKYFSMAESYNNRNSILTTSLDKYQINDNNLLKPRDEVHDQSGPKNIIMTTNKTETTANPNQNQNISQIEENIDKLVKSSAFVTVLKSNSFNQEEHQKLSPTSNEEEASACVTVSGEEPKVPEFMKIQLNKIEVTRPKSSHIVLSTKLKAEKELPPINVNISSMNSTRRLSIENIEIFENKPPLPPTATNRYSLNKSQEFDEIPTSPIRKSASMERKSSSSSILDESNSSKRSSISSTNENFDDRKVILQRRTSVSEEKLKYERRISSSGSEEVPKIERKKSSSEDFIDNCKNNMTDDENNVVILRKKTDAFTTSREDTPELMKVFARRSLKIKSDDEYKIIHDEIQENIRNSNNLSSSLDSDKENQSSEEKLDKIPKVELKISNSMGMINNNNNTNNNNNNINNNNNNNNNKDKDDKFKVISENTTEVLRKSSIPNAPPIAVVKPFGTNRFAATSNFRNSSTFLDVKRSLQQKSNTTMASTTTTTTTTSSATTTITPGSTTTGNHNSSTIITELNLNRNTMPPILDDLSEKKIATDKSEFKGILQRRAEWEKRAKEGSK